MRAIEVTRGFTAAPSRSANKGSHDCFLPITLSSIADDSIGIETRETYNGCQTKKNIYTDNIKKLLTNTKIPVNAHNNSTKAVFPIEIKATKPTSHDETAPLP